ncbi:signal transduction histidine kinase [Streptomyces phaeochromogenes]|jgi:signal transduction histidine kinase|uniref:sensor histidine kinase n=1 Tax=Streptomyces TaxID=1883 RepID=UPI00278DF08A|nr:ATP-binding protein [Streptomyces phaeochromogenes]MDQ0949269.1 signal transduction histidine kinase [Streptomyces phaeochromogenes]
MSERPGLPGVWRIRGRKSMRRLRGIRGPQSIRWRLTLVYSGLFVVAGAVLLALTYTLMSERGGQVSVTRPDVPAPGAGVPDVRGYVREQLVAQRSDQLHQLFVESGVALGVMALASLLLGWLVAGRVLAPLRSMTGAVRRISADALHRRLAVAGPADELKDLADTFDDLLARLEGAFEAQRRFVANASHELRTPLTLQQAVIDVALADPGAGVEALRSACLRVRAAGQEQERLIEALLTLALSQRGVPEREFVDLSVVAAELLPDGGPRVSAELAPAALVGDPQLIGRLVSNLVENAVRHNVPSGEGGWVSVWTGVVDGRASLRVVNSGPVVPSDQVGVLFEPFRRLGVERVRARAREGSGLGLSIVAAIAAAHGGVVEARARGEGGLWVEVVFPPPPPLPIPVPSSGAPPPNPRSSNAGGANY